MCIQRWKKKKEKEKGEGGSEGWVVVLGLRGAAGALNRFSSAFSVQPSVTDQIAKVSSTALIISLFSPPTTFYFSLWLLLLRLFPLLFLLFLTFFPPFIAFLAAWEMR